MRFKPALVILLITAICLPQFTPAALARRQTAKPVSAQQALKNLRAIDTSTESAPQQWRTAVTALQQVAERKHADEILSIWLNITDQRLAYDLAWLLGYMRATDQLATQLDHPETWRREQVALILYGHSDRLTLDQAGKILRTGLLCRYQQLWLITSVVRHAHPEGAEIVAFLEQYHVKPSPELLYELRNINKAWISAQIRDILVNGEEADRVRMAAMLPDFFQTDLNSLIELALKDTSGRVRAAALLALYRLDRDKALKLLDTLPDADDWHVIRAKQQITGSAGTIEQITKYALTLANFTLTDDQADAAAEWIDEFAEARDVRVIKAMSKLVTSGTHIKVRAAAIRYLGQVDAQESLAMLRAQLHDSNALIVKESIEALGRLGSGEDVDPLMSYLRNPGHAGTAAIALANLCLKLKQSEPQRAAAAASAVIDALKLGVGEWYAADLYFAAGLLADARYLPQIVAAASVLTSYNDRDLAAMAMASIDRRQALTLLQSMAVTAGEFQETALLLLSRRPLADISSGPIFTNVLASENINLHEAAIEGLATLKYRAAIEPLKSILRSGRHADYVRTKAAVALYIIAPETPLTDKSFLSYDRDYLQFLAAYNYSRFDGARQREARKALKQMRAQISSDSWQRAVTNAALIQAGDYSASTELVSLITNIDNTEVVPLLLYPLGNLPEADRKRLLLQVPALVQPSVKEVTRDFTNLMLALLGQQSASEQLLNTLSSDNWRNDEEEFITALKVLTLGARPASGVVESLLNIVNQGEKEPHYNFVSGAAVMALGDLGDKRALPALRRARLSIDPLISFYAASAMYKLADEGWTLELLRSNTPELIRAGIYISERISARGMTKELVRLLTHDDWRVRGYAAYMLGRRLTGIERAVTAERMLAQVRDNDASLRVRDEARAALLHIEHPEVIEETYFEAGLLLDWAGKSYTGFEELLPLRRLKALSSGHLTITQALRRLAKGQLNAHSRSSRSPLHNLIPDFTDTALSLHLLGEARTHDAFDLLQQWAADPALKGTIVEEAHAAAIAILAGEMGDPRALPLIQQARARSREWLVRALINVGEEKLIAASKRRNDQLLSLTNKNQLSHFAPLPSHEEIVRAVGGWADASALRTRLAINFTDLRSRKSYTGEGQLFWQGFDRLRLRVSAPLGSTIADLALDKSQMELAIYHPYAERRLLRGPATGLQGSNEELVKRAGPFSALRPDHLLAALRIPLQHEIKGIRAIDRERVAVELDSDDGKRQIYYLERTQGEWRLTQIVWNDDSGRVMMRAQYTKPFKLTTHHGSRWWASEVKVERPQDGYALQFLFFPADLRIGEKLPVNTFRLGNTGNLPVINL